MKLSDFDYHLPEALIAQHPPDTRAGGRLLDVAALSASAASPAVGMPTPADRLLTDLPALLAPGSLLVFNDTRVINARLQGRKESGGRIEVMVERLDDEFEVLAMVRASHPPREGSRIFFGEAPTGVSAMVVAARQPGSMLLRLRFDEPAAGVLERLGQLPLPPYIQHTPQAEDRERYQTVFAREPGAVAAPTAGLHFDEPLLAALRARGIESTRLTLHVGAGTFLPVRTDDLSQHRMHAERYIIHDDSAAAIARARADGRPVVAVGTTALRALEASGGQAGPGETDLFITPGYRFRVVDRLFTNFHLPKSTLLILVSAFAGREVIRRAYAHAIAQRYRFFSYGDAMLLDRHQAC
ncbi:MAG: tRNA preQ1(34) S-adenosylmethionine ribosyltransferase-isomerase QueA [Lautropia sp.]|nr:tRNA preQ1(34) S-adenosylmethionine ribosyltransferase-isomerase QueA [Lautropia sp.]